MKISTTQREVLARTASCGGAAEFFDGYQRSAKALIDAGLLAYVAGGKFGHGIRVTITPAGRAALEVG